MPIDTKEQAVSQLRKTSDAISEAVKQVEVIWNDMPKMLRTEMMGAFIEIGKIMADAFDYAAKCGQAEINEIEENAKRIVNDIVKGES